MTSANESAEKPRFGVRLSRGIVTYWQDDPLTTYEKAAKCRALIEELMGERGEIEEVYVLTTGRESVAGEDAK